MNNSKTQSKQKNVMSPTLDTDYEEQEEEKKVNLYLNKNQLK